eukprot:840073-Rhodomonas_salina.2
MRRGVWVNFRGDSETPCALTTSIDGRSWGDGGRMGWRERAREAERRGHGVQSNPRGRSKVDAGHSSIMLNSKRDGAIRSHASRHSLSRLSIAGLQRSVPPPASGLATRPPPPPAGLSAHIADHPTSAPGQTASVDNVTGTAKSSISAVHGVWGECLVASVIEGGDEFKLAACLCLVISPSWGRVSRRRVF